jgi:excinuclease ABC subunit C
VHPFTIGSLQWIVRLPEPHATLIISDQTSDLAPTLSRLPDAGAVFRISPQEGAPYLARTHRLRRRLHRLLALRDHPSRFLNLRAVAARVDYWLTASSLDASLLHYVLARHHFPDHYRSLLKLHPPAFVKLILSNAFPRAQVTRRLSGSQSFYYGPFRTRAAAEDFQTHFLDLFQLRRCEENLVPSDSHPGCIYGEMGLCLRPCQEAVGPEEYASEVARVVEFLSTGGASLVTTMTSARDRLSEEMDFEQAARLHRRLDKIQDVLRLRDPLATDIRRLHGVAVTASTEPLTVELRFLMAGAWLPVQFFRIAPEAASVSMDHRLREMTASLALPKLTVDERQDHLTLLARWYYATWRDGDWIPFDDPAAIPYRKLVRAISRQASNVPDVY